jgi:hypothetical protein
MKVAIGSLVLFICGLMSFSAEGADKKPAEFCIVPPKTPQQKCKEAGGEWKDDVCYKTKRRIVKRIVRRVVRSRIPAMVITSPPPVCNCPTCPACPKVEAKPANISMSQKITFTSPAFLTDTAKSQLVLSPPDEKWWWMGPGVFAAGIWVGKKDFFFGPYGTLVFAINQRFRTAGSVGMSYSVDTGGLGLWLGGYGAVRAYKGLFVNFGLETFWSEFQSLTVKRRMIALSSGPEYWFNNRASISLRFMFGIADVIENCKELTGYFTVGNLFTATLYF